MEAADITFGLTVSICYLVGIPFLVLLWLRSDFQPIRVRPFLCTFIGQMVIINFITSISFSYFFEDTFPCLLKTIGTEYSSVFIGNSYFVGVWSLWLLATLTKQKLEYADQMVVNWLLKYQRKITKKNLFLAFICFSLFQSVCQSIILTYFVYFGGYRLYGNCVQNLIYDISVTIIPMSLTMIGWWIGVWKIRSIPDPFYVKREFMYMSAVGTISTVFIVVQLIVNTGFPLIDFARVWVTLSVFFMSTVFMVCKSFSMNQTGKKRPRNDDARDGDGDGDGAVEHSVWKGIRDAWSTHSREGASSSNTSGYNAAWLGDILEDVEGRRQFREHLIAEFSVENLLFWEDVVKFNKTFSDVKSKREEFQMMTSALSIYLKYLSLDSPLAVNISYKSRNSVFQTLSKCVEDLDSITMENLDECEVIEIVPIDIFDAAQQECFGLMATDSFVRFNFQSYHSV